MDEVLDQRLGRVRCAVEAVYHRHNVAAILRTCDALGIHHVHLVAGEGGAVSKGPARGAERWLELHRHDSTAEGLAAIRAAGCSLWVADLAGDAVTPEDLPVDRPVCLWFGAELLGVSAEARAEADGVVAVPMRGMAQSLNVSVAAALALRPVAERARALGAAALLDPGERARVRAAWLEREHEMLAGIDEREGAE
jgi:tRNA (guanosine-2'-O-)-methyltransferase